MAHYINSREKGNTTLITSVLCIPGLTEDTAYIWILVELYIGQWLLDILSYVAAKRLMKSDTRARER